MSKPKEFWIVYSSQGSCMLCHKEPEIKIQFGNEYIHVREVTPADEAKDAALREAKAVIKAYSSAIKVLISRGVDPGTNSADSWLKKYGDPEGTSND